MSDIRFGVTPLQRELLVEAVLREAKRLEQVRNGLLEATSDNALLEARSVHKQIKALEDVYMALNVETVS